MPHHSTPKAQANRVCPSQRPSPPPQPLYLGRVKLRIAERTFASLNFLPDPAIFLFVASAVDFNLWSDRRDESHAKAFSSFSDLVDEPVYSDVYVLRRGNPEEEDLLMRRASGKDRRRVHLSILGSGPNLIGVSSFRLIMLNCVVLNVAVLTRQRGKVALDLLEGYRA